MDVPDNFLWNNEDFLGHLSVYEQKTQMIYMSNNIVYSLE